MEVIVIARSIGRENESAPLSKEGHAALVFNLGDAGANDHWIAQAGPQQTGSTQSLVGGLQHVSLAGWFHDFSLAKGGIWNHPAKIALVPVMKLQAFSIRKFSVQQLRALVESVNHRKLAYNYATGPNSNSFVRILLASIGHPVPTAPVGIVLKGWEWQG